MRKITQLVAAFLLVVASPGVRAGVTLHYEGAAKNQKAITSALATARAEAQRLGWKVADANEASASITRTIDDIEAPYRGTLTGIVIYPHPMCEPLYLQFGSDLFLQDFVKTQFAGADVHIAIVELLHKLEPYFQTLAVEDEGEFWGTADRTKLLSNLDAVNTMIESIKQSRPGAKGPIKLPNGRILDVAAP